MIWEIPEDDERVVMFTGRSNCTYIGLGGSKHHLIGHGASRTNPLFGSSHASAISDYLTTAVKTMESNILGEEDTFEYFYDEEIKSPSFEKLIKFHRSRVHRYLSQNIEYFAKTLIFGNIIEKFNSPTDYSSSREQEYMIVIGSPIYIALVD